MQEKKSRKIIKIREAGSVILLFKDIKKGDNLKIPSPHFSPFSDLFWRTFLQNDSGLKLSVTFKCSICLLMADIAVPMFMASALQIYVCKNRQHAAAVLITVHVEKFGLKRPKISLAYWHRRP